MFDHGQRNTHLDVPDIVSVVGGVLVESMDKQEGSLEF
jgi:hypothetical protein